MATVAGIPRPRVPPVKSEAACIFRACLRSGEWRSWRRLIQLSHGEKWALGLHVYNGLIGAGVAAKAHTYRMFVLAEFDRLIEEKYGAEFLNQLVIETKFENEDPEWDKEFEAFLLNFGKTFE
jgi:hypothetical protein